jgi:hypothetical protein
MPTRHQHITRLLIGAVIIAIALAIYFGSLMR